ncbi:MAG TPA: ATP-binding protein [Candidatus Onthocola stercoravium]|nr:ATP-binding protein [Candidatus Onthocola stercoravium]
MLLREDYLSKIREFYDLDIIKILIGIRRCGKSVLLKQIIDEIKNTVDDNHIIYINFEDVTYAYIKNYLDLNDYVNEKIVDDKKYYLFFDEIQMVDDWEKAINSFKATLNVSIFITGSNSKLLSGEFATLLSGRYVSFKVFPFSFKEVIDLKKLTDIRDIEDAFNDYILWGGLPQRFDFGSQDAMISYLSDVFNSIVLKDIVKRNNIKNIDLFERVMEYLVTNPSQSFSPANMMNEFSKENIPVSSKTIYECLDYATSAMLMEKISAYDIRGKKILSRKDKYYLMDLGLGRILNTNKKAQYGAYLENIVYNELRYRGYEVSIGNNDGREIDFIATKHNIKEYYQVAYTLADENTERREFNAFDNIKDNYPKYVISTDKLDYSQNGIIHKSIIDWLLNK